ncbi:MAG: hypothetical protein M3388_08100 [Acidobacteriota bacterium]|nr:hypothetical protein [Acidobacteriota bacterium]
MFKKILSFALIVLLLNVVGVSSAYSQEDKQARAIEKVRENVRKLGVGEAAQIEIKLLDGRKIKGYIRETSEDSFVVVDAKTSAAATVDYSQVKQIKGRNRLTAAKVGLTIVKGVAIVAVVAVVATVAAAVLLNILLKEN